MSDDELRTTTKEQVQAKVFEIAAGLLMAVEGPINSGTMMKLIVDAVNVGAMLGAETLRNEMIAEIDHLQAKHLAKLQPTN